MKKFLYTILLVPALAFAAAGNTTADQQLERLKKEWAQTVDALQGYTAAKRDDAVKEAKKSLDAVDKRINWLERRSSDSWHTLSDQARESKQAALEKMRKMRNNASAWFGAMQHSSKESWNDVRTGFIDAYQELSESFQQAAQEFNDNKQNN